MDGLAAKSVRFHRAYAQGGWTSISLPTFMWSRNPRDIRFVPLYETPTNDRFLAADLPPGTPVTAIFPAPQPEPTRSLAELLRAARIRTVVVRNDESNWPFDPELGFVRGFERIAHAPPDAGRSSLENDAETARTAVEEIRRAGSERFFLWIHLFGPHLPFLRGPDAPRSFSDYEAEVHQVDRLVASLLAAIDETGRGADTAIVLTADHGEELGERGGRGHGLNLFEESIRVPLLVFAPGASPRDIRETVGLTDLAPTLLGLLGLRTPGAMQGYSLRPFLESARRTSRPPVTVDTWRKDRAGTIDLHLVAAVDERHKVVLDLLTGAVAAFDLERDPSERRPTGPNDAGSDTAATLAGWTRVR